MQNVYSVGQVNAYIKNMFTQDFLLKRIYVKGEVSNCKYHSAGHIYFSLKDATGTIACVMFAGSRKGLGFRMTDGQQVVVLGTVSVYERDGRYQLYASEIRQDGAGLLYERFEALKKELEEMGMFAPEYKQPIPAYIRKLGIVTAPTGAAVRDIMNISRRRNPFIQLVLYPALVQGEGAADSIVKGIRMLDDYGVDTIIVGRGGGSIEDLWAFNEEKVARAIFECETPVISAVGHETDTTISDFVADLRAPTPSAAAELAVADIRQILDRMDLYRKRLEGLMGNTLDAKRQKLVQYQLKVSHLSPQNQIREMRQLLADRQEDMERLLTEQIRQARQDTQALHRSLEYGMEQQLTRTRHRMLIYIEKMKGLSPLEKLGQGYAWLSDSGNRKITSIAQAGAGTPIQVDVRDGRILATVDRTEPREEPWTKND
ncbi:MAG: exodeoxyribonuclease VII large subunit [Candidatus Limivivens sp.]|nr:exodeoxyribonuclease VII large subunit [Candidatus Limivivens sp.]